MIKTGHIRIRDKVYFEYYELEKPDQNDVGKYGEFSNKYFDDLREYEASKRLVEVNNKTHAAKNSLRYWLLLPHKAGKIEIWDIVRNNQPCKAEVKEKATIIELTKE